MRAMPETGRIGLAHGVSAPEAYWLAGIRARNPDALKHLYHRYRAPVLRFLSLVEPERAPAEACLDVFEEVWHRAATSPPDSTVAEWVLGIAYGVLLRHAKFPGGALASAQEELSSGPRRILCALSWEQRVVVALVYASELSIDSIEVVTGMTHEEITGHLSKACALLRLQVRQPTPETVTIRSTT